MTTDWNEIPYGIYVIRTFHKRTGQHCFHLNLKVDDRPYYNQPNVPADSESDSPKRYGPFWEWAKQHLPIYDHTEAI